METQHRKCVDCGKELPKDSAKNKRFCAECRRARILLQKKRHKMRVIFKKLEGKGDKCE